jgi:hypothetical protein
MNTAPVYQLIANHHPERPRMAVTLSVSADTHNLSDAASRAIGLGGWAAADLAVVTWHDGEASAPVAWGDF